MKKKKELIISLVLIAVLIAILRVMEINISPQSKLAMLMTVLKKGSIYALVAVSMNLLNGFTGLFSLGQAELTPMRSLRSRRISVRWSTCITTAV